MVCTWRALETLLPKDQRVIDDPYARAFLGPARSALVEMAERFPQRALKALLRRIDRVLQGAMTFVLARHRAMDELLVANRGEDVEQVVLLGTGYDTRAVRLASALDGATLYEVDHPATAKRRASLVESAFHGLPTARRVPVNVDFQRESLEERLVEAGFKPGQPTFWIWEGVTMYLEEAAVRETLDMVRRLSAAGDLITCDVWCPPAERLQKLARRDLPSLAMRLVYQEPFVWGPPVEQLEPFFRDQGLALIECTPAEELVKRYTARKRGLFEVGTNAYLTLAEVDREV